MPFQLSPGVNIQERDLTSIIPAVATTSAGIAGHFQWGPVDQRIIVDSENNLAQLFGLPDINTFEWFFTAANFLQYGNNLQVIRTIDTSNTINAGAGTTANPAILIRNLDDWNNKINPSGGSTPSYATNSNAYWAAKWPGTLGNSLIVCACDTTGGFANWAANGVTLNTEFSRTPGTSTYVENTSGLTQANDEIHIAIVDKDGKFAGYKNAVIEVWEGLSKAIDGKRPDGSSNYYVNVLNNDSRYVWFVNPLPGIQTGRRASDVTTANYFGAINAQAGFTGTYFGGTGYASFSCTGGLLGLPADSLIATAKGASSGFGLFSDADFVDVSLLLGGPLAGSDAATVAQIASSRKDCVAFFSAPNSDPLASTTTKIANCTSLKDSIGNNSYAVIDSTYKKQVDRYNNVYRWVPCNGDVAGLCAQTDQTNDPWWSPAGFNRGNVRNVIQLAFNPAQADRDIIYPKGINPIVTFPGDGTILYGDKTALSKPSAFDRINVRRLFIVLEKAVAIASKYQLFEFNDAFTRSMFVSMLEPFLRDIQARRGIYDFKVICDETNNTSEVIDSNRFVADIFIKPARTINYVQLNFIATRTGASFEEITALSQPGLGARS
jgi:hypothetical protein